MCEEQGIGVYSYRTDTMIQIVDAPRGHDHRVYKAGKLVQSGELDPSLDDPMIVAMWVELGCPTARMMGFPNYCETHAIKEAFDNEYRGVDHERFVRDKIRFHGGDDWKPCKGEDECPNCEGGCTVQDFVESAQKRGVTVQQVMRDSDCRCKKCRQFGM